MANLTPEEFGQIVRCLAHDLGLQRLRDKLVRLNALVTRRRVASPEALADQLYMLTGGLRRQVTATLAVQSLWAEQMHDKLGEENEKGLEKVAEQINACLSERDLINPEKAAELDDLLRVYEQRLAEQVGAERARIDMLLKTVPAVAERLRALPVAAVPAGAAAEPSAG